MEAIEKSKEKKSSIQLSKALIARLGALGKKGDTYEVIIWRLLTGCNPAMKGVAHENRGDTRDESDRIGHHQK